MIVLAFLLIIIILNDLISINAIEGEKNRVKKIAVCIGGQAARWQPQHLLDGLIFPNLKDNYHFFMFSNIQHSQVVFNTDTSNTFSPSLISGMNIDKARSYLDSLAFHSPLVTVASLKYSRMITKEALLKYFNVSKLDRITQYTDVQTTILNMYAHQVMCVQQILQFEQDSSTDQPFRFDCIISTREDIFFFRPINITKVISRLRTDTSPGSLLAVSIKKSQRNYRQNPIPPVCDIIYKKCRNFWGFNMRLYILTREVGIQFLGNRFSFYKYLYQINQTILNPERFELSQANALRLFGCPVSVEEFPVTAIRHFFNGQMCFVFFEIDRCVPLAYHEFAKNLLCLEMRRNFFLDKIYTEVPELLQANMVTGIDKIALTEEKKFPSHNLDFMTLQRYYRKVLNLLPSPSDYNNRSKVREVLLQNERRRRRSLPKTLPRYTADPYLVALTWIERDYDNEY